MKYVAHEGIEGTQWTLVDVVPDPPRPTKVAMPDRESGDGHEGNARNHLLMRIAARVFVVTFLGAVALLGAAAAAFSQTHLVISLALLTVAAGALGLLMREAAKPVPAVNFIHYLRSPGTFWTS